MVKIKLLVRIVETKLVCFIFRCRPKIEKSLGVYRRVNRRAGEFLARKKRSLNILYTAKKQRCQQAE